jgi:ketosteroid isomerase-like protein
VKRASKAGGLVLLGVLSTCATPPESGAEAVATIQEASDSLEAAYQRGDADAVADLSTEDAVISPVGMSDLQGRESIR